MEASAESQGDCTQATLPVAACQFPSAFEGTLLCPCSDFGWVRVIFLHSSQYEATF